MFSELVPYKVDGSFRALDTCLSATSLVYSMGSGGETTVRRSKFDVHQFESEPEHPFVIFPAGEYDAVFSTVRNDTGFVLSISDQLLGNILRAEDAFPNLHLFAGGVKHAKLKRLMRALIARQKNPLLAAELSVCIAEVLLEMEGRLPSARSLRSFSPQVRNRIQEYVRTCVEAGQGIEFEDLMTLSGFGATHFRARFVECFGVNPNEYVQRVRVDVAVHWLKNKNMPISVVAEKLGFNSPAHFASRFRWFTGCSPTTSRRLR